jgi:hypothetical protein
MLLDLVAYNVAQCNEMQNYVDSNINESNLSEEELKMQWVMKFAAKFAVENRHKYVLVEQTV